MSLCCAFIWPVVFLLTAGAGEGFVAAFAGAAGGPATPVSARAISQCSARCLPFIPPPFSGQRDSCFIHMPFAEGETGKRNGDGRL